MTHVPEFGPHQESHLVGGQPLDRVLAQVQVGGPHTGELHRSAGQHLARHGVDRPQGSTGPAGHVLDRCHQRL